MQSMRVEEAENEVERRRAESEREGDDTYGYANGWIQSDLPKYED